MSGYYKLMKLRFGRPLQAEEAEICRTSCMKLRFARPLQAEEDGI